MSLNGFEFFLLILASFRLTRLIVFDKIFRFVRSPFLEVSERKDQEGNVIEHVEAKGNGLRKLIGELLSCYWCFGIWSSLFLYGGFVLISPIFYPLIIVLAVAGAASVIEFYV